MKNDSVTKVDQTKKPTYTAPELTCLSTDKTETGFAGAFEATFPAFPDQSLLQAS